MNKSDARRLRSLITQYRNAAIEDSWKGGGDPDNIPEIEANYQRKGELLDEFITRLTK